MMIRSATKADQDAIREVNLAAFAEEERELVANLAVGLLSEESRPETVSLVAEMDGKIVGHIAFSPLTGDKAAGCLGYLLAPLAVHPGNQRSGIGSQLVREGKQRLEAMGITLLMVYGDPAYYGRFGFSAEAAEPYGPPYPLQYPFGWLAMSLREGVLPAACAQVRCVASLCDPKLW